MGLAFAQPEHDPLPIEQMLDVEVGLAHCLHLAERIDEARPRVQLLLRDSRLGLVEMRGDFAGMWAFDRVAGGVRSRSITSLPEALRLMGEHLETADA